jgi:protein phosphatase 2C family protein 2/3
MEDSHAIVLDLEAENDKQNCFFAVYDGHGGAPLLTSSMPENVSHIDPLGSSVAKFAGQNVHKRLVTEETYKNDDFEAALKKAFLGTDEDILASQFIIFFVTSHLDVSVDPAHTRDPSGCTAVAALLTHDNKIYVVCPLSTHLSVSFVMTNYM